MADNADAGSDVQVTFKVKTSSDTSHSITMAESATVLDLKTKLSGEDFENIPVERQRLIYSGRVMKNDDSLGTYKIKNNNTVHMVKSAASNPTQPNPTAPPAPQAVPTNMASGTANNPLAGLTGARYAGHQINLPGMEMFGPDGGMGPPMDEQRVQQLMADPNVQQSMNEALNNPDFVNMLIQSNPMLRSLPNARELITSPFMRQMMSNPQMMGQAMRMQRNMRGGGDTAFPAPGATDTTEGSAAGNNGQNNAAPRQSPYPPNPFMQQLGDEPDVQSMLSQLEQMNALGLGGFGSQAAADRTEAVRDAVARGRDEATAAQGAAAGSRGDGSSAQGQNPPPANPFAALFNPGGAAAQAGGNPINPMDPDMLMRMMQALSGSAQPAAPADNRPPEERYEDQLRQLNDMGFFDFDRNVAALRRSGGSVQGAVEYLLSSGM